MKARFADILRRLADRLDPPPRAQWHPLPGNMLELGATGFRLELKPSDPRADIIVWNPEGKRIGSGREWQLQEAKELAEHCAKNRAEFVPAEAWKPMTDPRHLAPVTELFDPEIHQPPRCDEHLLLINPGGVLITGPWHDGCLAWGYKPRIPASVKARMAKGTKP